MIPPVAGFGLVKLSKRLVELGVVAGCPLAGSLGVLKRLDCVGGGFLKVQLPVEGSDMDVLSKRPVPGSFGVVAKGLMLMGGAAPKIPVGDEAAGFPNKLEDEGADETPPNKPWPVGTTSREPENGPGRKGRLSGGFVIRKTFWYVGLVGWDAVDVLADAFGLTYCPPNGFLSRKGEKSEFNIKGPVLPTA